LADLWTNGPDRKQVAQAADDIDAALAHAPSSQGESRSGPTRILIIVPLAVLFRVYEQARLVTVLKVWRWGSKP
jgi:hypothetical protein